MKAELLKAVQENFLDSDIEGIVSVEIDNRSVVVYVADEVARQEVMEHVDDYPMYIDIKNV